MKYAVRPAGKGAFGLTAFPDMSSYAAAKESKCNDFYTNPILGGSKANTFFVQLFVSGE